MRLSIIIFLFFVLVFSNCAKKTRYPCPGNGQYSPSQLNLFDEDGAPKEKKKKKKMGRKDEVTGLLNKKKNLKIKRHIQTSLDDKPKHVKK